MDEKEELAKAKWLLGAAAFFLLSCFFVYDEVSYLFWGREAEASVVQAHETRQRSRFGVGGRTRLEVDFTFTEPDGTRRKGTDTVARRWSVPRTGTVTVEYTPGELGRARLKGHVYWSSIIFFLVSLGAVAVAGFLLWREGVEATREDTRKRKARRSSRP